MTLNATKISCTRIKEYPEFERDFKVTLGKQNNLKQN